MKPAVGILGGMGPQATIDLMTRVVAAIDARDDSDHVPLIVHQNPQVPSRIAAILGGGGGADPAPILAGMVRDLERAGAIALAMPCNTAHAYAEVIEEAASVPFLNMVDMAADEAAWRVPGGCVGLMGSPALTLGGVYDRPLHARGLTSIAPPAAALPLIQQIKSGGLTREARTRFRALADEMKRGGADAICVCCTEFSLYTDALDGIGLPVFDSMSLLADAIIQFSTVDVCLPQADALSGSALRVRTAAE
ncbi:MAG: amino acid racemase [Pseudomonadota bacterium]